jgi:hypothetical protein
MKITPQISLICLTAWLLSSASISADTVLLSNGWAIPGSVIQSNADALLVLAGNAVFSFSRSTVVAIQTNSVQDVNPSDVARIPDFREIVLLLSQQSWATNLTPIPATVIDKGILRNVPYSSFRCGEDYEVNVYGDLEHPAGFEIGVYRKLLVSKSAQTNCVTFISDLLTQPTDKKVLLGLDLLKDLKTSDDLTFEITPPTGEDSYNGWWISVYSEHQLDLARASDAEMKQISVTKADVVRQSNPGDKLSAWSADDMRSARSSPPTAFTFTNSSGEVITNAEVVRMFVPGVSLIWRSGSAMGMVKLADLPEALRSRFGYDPVKTTEAEQTERDKKEQWQQQVLAAQAAQPSGGFPQPGVSGSDYSSGGYGVGSDYSSGGGSVYVHGYTRRDGTYVQGYTRR